MQLWSKEIPHYDSNIGFQPYLTPYLVENARMCVVICPGGGYMMRAEHEGEGYALWLNRIGISAVVLEYRVNPYLAPAEASDVQRAIRVVRKELAPLGVEKIGVMGSSAGGHLAATASVYFDKQFYEPIDEVDEISARPDFSILCYPVIDMTGQYSHQGSVENLLGLCYGEKDAEFYSLQLQVNDNTPPTFLWHTAADNAVPVENTLLYAMALSRHKVPFEVHIFPEGCHGLGLAESDPYVHEWANALERWLLY